MCNEGKQIIQFFDFATDSLIQFPALEPHCLSFFDAPSSSTCSSFSRPLAFWFNSCFTPLSLRVSLSSLYRIRENLENWEEKKKECREHGLGFLVVLSYLIGLLMLLFSDWMETDIYTCVSCSKKILRPLELNNGSLGELESKMYYKLPVELLYSWKQWQQQHGNVTAAWKPGGKRMLLFLQILFVNRMLLLLDFSSFSFSFRNIKQAFAADTQLTHNTHQKLVLSLFRSSFPTKGLQLSPEITVPVAAGSS